MTSTIRLTKAQARELRNKGSVQIKTKTFVTIEVTFEEDENNQEHAVARIIDTIEEVHIPRLEPDVLGYCIHAFFTCENPNIDNDINIEVNEKFEPFEDVNDALISFFRILDNTRRLTKLKKQNQFETLELIVVKNGKKQNHKREVLVSWDVETDVVKWKDKETKELYGRDN